MTHDCCPNIGASGRAVIDISLTPLFPAPPPPSPPRLALIVFCCGVWCYFLGHYVCVRVCARVPICVCVRSRYPRSPTQTTTSTPPAGGGRCGGTSSASCSERSRCSSSRGWTASSSAAVAEAGAEAGVRGEGGRSAPFGVGWGGSERSRGCCRVIPIFGHGSNSSSNRSRGRGRGGRRSGGSGGNRDSGGEGIGTLPKMLKMKSGGGNPGFTCRR